ncbi:hypothetical protein H6F97_11515 [Microcoleus sp. FACHB-1]|nr:hypothetical protein [Microcoleus sp. FACHB-1]
MQDSWIYLPTTLIFVGGQGVYPEKPNRQASINAALRYLRDEILCNHFHNKFTRIF